MNKQDYKVCWRKLDRKSKKVNFMITQQNEHLDEKAGVHNIQELTEEIEHLQYKLDQISMNIVSQIETEKVHFERKYTPRKTLTSICSDPRHNEPVDLDEPVKDDACARNLRWTGLPDDFVLQQGEPRKAQHQPLRWESDLILLRHSYHAWDRDACMQVSHLRRL